ncbi:MAG: hypothetical protein ACOY9Y_15650 [Bacillota bacterium]
MNMDLLLQRHTAHLMNLPNVVGVGRGTKTVRGEDTGRTAVVVLVEKKVPEKELARGQRIPKLLGETPTDVLEVGEIRLLNRTGYSRPAYPGMSIGHYKSSAGTFGALVKDRRTGQPLILSNNHVVANATDGYDANARIGDPVLQPGAYDGGTMEQVVGYLERYIPLRREYASARCRTAKAAEKIVNQVLRLIWRNYRIALQKGVPYDNLVDAAVVRPVSLEAVGSEILEVGKIKGVAEAQNGMRVKKSGRSSGLTTGTVQVTRATLTVTISGNQKGMFADQFVTTGMSKGGDSGSLVLDMNNNAVGLLFAGSDTKTVCNRIQNVMDMLQIDFY